MRRKRLLTGMAVLLLAGCGAQNLWRSDTQRFELALPLSLAIDESARKVAKMIGSDAALRKQWQHDFDGRRDTRALKCLTSSLSVFGDARAIREKVDSACLSKVDEELLAWAQGSRLRILLAMPPLRPLPEKPPEFITTTDVPGVYGMADAAPILVVARDRKLEVLDAGSGQTIHRDEELPVRPNFLAPSPNGRVFASGEGSNVVMRDSENGEVLATYAGQRAFAWLDAITGILTGTEAIQRSLFDGTTATLTQPKGLATYHGTVVRVNESPAHYIVPGGSHLAKFELRHEGGPQIVMLEQRDRPRPSMDNGAMLGTPDGGHVIIADPQAVVVADTRTLEVRSIETGRFNPMRACPLEESDAVLIRGVLREQWSHEYFYVYSLDSDTFAPVEDERLLPSSGAVAECPVRFNAFKAVYVKTQSGFRRLDNVKRGLRFGQGAFEAYFTELFQAEQQRTLALRAGESAARSGMSSYGQAPGVPAKPLLGMDIKDAIIESVGVYEAEGSSRGAGAQAKHQGGPVTVLVRRADKPIVLVLSSYETVIWNLNVMTGANIKAILLAGYKSSTIIGGGDARVVRINGYAYKAGSSEYTALNEEVMRYTGRQMDRFQGTYRGRSFMVGGR